MTASDAQQLIMRPKEIYDGALPSGNSVAALSLLKLYALTHKQEYLTRLEALLDCFAETVARTPYAYSFLLSALDWQIQGTLEITFEGKADEGTVAKMLKVLYKHFMPSKAVKWMPSLKSTQAQFCYRGVCRAPIDDVGVFEQELMKGA